MPDVYTRVTETPLPLLESLMSALAEARRRISSGEHFGHIAYVSVVARQ